MRVAVDIGGTFTDIVAYDEKKAKLYTEKVLTTSSPEEGVLQAIDRLIASCDINPASINAVIHGTTLLVNSVTEYKGSKAGLIVTYGTKDVLEIGRQNRPLDRLYDFFFDRREPLVPRNLRVEVHERCAPEGVLQELDSQEAEQVVGHLLEKEVESIAICLLHSYRHPQHEMFIKDVVKRLAPQICVCASAEILPEYREYERMSTTVINAYVMPVASRYIGALAAEIKCRGIPGELRLVTSAGGMMGAAAAQEKPVYLVESGPAAGAAGAAFFSKRKNVISFDMGGTTAKVAMIQNGEPHITYRFMVNQSYPVRVPVVDLVEIGQGGGSVGWIDPGGALRVGPRSAGANPGPACYGRGGTEPTVTDAQLVLGRLNPHYFLGGRQSLNVEEAEKALTDHIAAGLRISPVDSADGIIRVANTNMVNAIRLVTVERGIDPRECVLYAFGGMGAMHAVELADELKIPEINIPFHSGVFSAFGMLGMDVQYDLVQTYLSSMEGMDRKELQRVIDRLVGEARDYLKSDGFSEERMVIRISLDLRYVGQSYEINVPLAAISSDEEAIKQSLSAFHRLHELLYGHSTPTEPVEMVNIRVSGRGIVSKPSFNEGGCVTANRVSSSRGGRRVFFGGRFVETNIYRVDNLPIGVRVQGPAVIEAMESTVVVPPCWYAELNEMSQMVMRHE